MAPELKSERESAVVWRALVASHSPYQALCFAVVQMPSWYSAIDELMPHRGRRMDPEVPHGWLKLMECELMDAVKLVQNELKGCLVKLVKNEVIDELSHKIVGINDGEKIEEELVRNELMSSTEKGRFESRIKAPWCGSRVAGWRVAAGKTTVLMCVLFLLASEASLVSLALIWNAMVPRLEMATTLRKLDAKVTPITVVPALTVLLMQMTLNAAKTPEDSVTSIALVATMASVASTVASMVASMASMASTEMVAWMESKEAPTASLASVTPMARMALASLDLVASMASVADLNRRKLCNVT